MFLNLAEVATALNLKTTTLPQTDLTQVTFDSRQVLPGALFVPLVAQRDGHDFVTAAFKQGAQATLWQADHPLPPSADDRYLVVPDTLEALQKLSAYYLQKIQPQVVAITGSNGKTTTKDMTAAILAQKYRVVKTQANFNNEIGVPITILAMQADTQILVVEMGMDHAGQLTQLSALAHPDVAVITMIGEAHIEFFGTRAKIADAKMEIVKFLKPQGVLIFNGDEPLLQDRAAALKQKTLTFGRQTTNTLFAKQIQAQKDSSLFTTNIWPQQQFTLPLIGDYNVDNALAALLVGQHYGVTPAAMQQALAHFKPTKNRTQWLTAANGAQLLSDVYNANPTAMVDVISNFSRVPTTGRRILVLGDMLELGPQTAKWHAQLASVIDPHKIAAVYLYGDIMAALQAALVSKLPVYYFPTAQQEQLIAQLQQDVLPSDLVLLKASNGLHLERVVQALMDS